MKILVVDDHPLVREGLGQVLKGLDPRVQVLHAPRAQRAMEQVREHADLDLVLLDLNLPDHDGFELLDWFAGVQPDLPVVVLSGIEDQGLMRRALEKGAVGFIPKSSLSELIVPALQLVLAGGVYVPPAMVAPLAQRSRLGITATQPLDLTSRQREVLQLMLDGHANKEIARLLRLSEPTVKAHVSAILRALGVSTRTQAVMAAERHGLRPSGGR